MEPTVAVLGALQRLLDDFVFGEGARLDLLVDADDILPDDSAGADV